MGELFNFDDLKPTKRVGQFTMNCPFCISVKGTPDTKRKLGINTVIGKYNCFRCGTHGSISDLSELNFFTESKTPQPIVDKLRSRLNKSKDRITNSIELVNEVNLDKCAWKLTKEKTPFAYSYIKSRGFSDDEIEKYNLYVGHSFFDGEKLISTWSGRILFPVYYRGQLEGFIGRSINGAEPKYLNTQLSRSTLVYNLESVHGQAVVCEGIISSIAASRHIQVPCVGTFGKHITDFQLDRIRAVAGEVFFALDGDVDEAMLSDIYSRALSRGFVVWHVPLPNDKDPDDLGSDFVTYFNMAKRVYRARKNNLG